MRICIASSGLGHVSRGIETWAKDLSYALVERGESVLLCKGGGEVNADFERVIPCFQRSSPITQKLVDRWLSRGFWRLGIGSSYGLEQTTFALGLLKYLRRYSIDLLHVQDPGVALITQNARKLGLVRTRTVLGHGTNEPLDFLRKITYLQQLAPFHLDQTRDAGVWKPTWTAIPNFIDTDVFRPGSGATLRNELGIPRDGLVILTVAAIKRNHKRIDYLLEEVALLLTMAPQIPIWLVVAGGSEPDTDELVRRGREMLGDRVRFLIRFPRERMPELYRLADAFALCSLREMMPIALLEATASGLTCLVHRYPVSQWIVGPAGESVDMSEPRALSTALLTLLGDATRRRDSGLLLRQHCLEHFSKTHVVDQLLRYYRFVLEDSRSSTKTTLRAQESGTTFISGSSE